MAWHTQQGGRSKLLFIAGVLGAVFACSSRDSHPDATEKIGKTNQALTSDQIRILGYESLGDWQLSNLQAQLSSTHVEGSNAFSVVVNQSGGTLTSVPLSTLGPIASTATLKVQLPNYLQGQAWQGQIAAYVNAPSAGIYNQYVGPAQFQNATVNSWLTASFNLPSFIVTALSTKTYSDLTVKVELDFNPNSTSSFTNPATTFLVDSFSFGTTNQADGGAGSGGASGSSGSTGSGATSGSGSSVGGTTGSGATTSSGGTSGSASGAAGAAGGSGTTSSGGSTSGTGATSGSSTSGGATSPGGTSGSSSGIGGTSGTGGATGPCSFSPQPGGPTTPYVFSIKLPHGIGRESVGVATTGGSLTLDDGVQLVSDTGGFVSASSVTATARTNLGVGATVYNLFTEPLGIDLRSNANVVGELVTAADVSEQAGATVTGATVQNANLQPLDSVSWGVAFPNANRGSCSIEPDLTQVVDPGSYGDVAVKSRSHLKLSGAGTYFFNSLSFEPSAVLDIQNTAGPVFIYIANGFAFSGQVVEADTSHMNFLFGVAGSAPINIQTPFRGILVAPSAAVSLPSDTTSGHVGSFFAQSLIAHQSTLLHQRPFAPAEFCAADAVCSEFCPCAAGGACTASDQCQAGLSCDAMGKCACVPSCAGKHCGDANVSDGCGGVCTGLCQSNQVGCTSDPECPAGQVCGINMGSRFGFADGTNICWSRSCALQDPSKPNCGVDPALCGTCPACTPQCASGSTGPDGCGGFCGACAAGETRLGSGECVSTVLATHSISPADFPKALTPIATDGAGTLPGSFDVTDRGTAAYTIPLLAPPGRMGLQPALSLNYSSTRNNGMLGMGWSLGGLSSIKRCNTIDGQPPGATAPGQFFGAAHPVQLFADTFCLDGKPLVVVPGGPGYGEDGAHYRTEIDTFVDVVEHNFLAGPGIPGAPQGPRSFDVYEKDGRILRYGETEDASVYAEPPIQPSHPPAFKRIWALDKVEDRSGNFMRITYLTAQTQGLETISTAEVLPYVISYGGTPSSNGSRFVVFNYEDRPDARSTFIDGNLAVSANRLKNVTMFVGLDLVNSYDLSYLDGSRHESLLRAVQECGTDSLGNEACLPQTTFEYNAPGENAGLAFGKFDVSSLGTPIVLDADGDGKDDVLANGSTGPWSLIKPFLKTTTSAGFQADPQFCATSDGVIDVNRDGKDDIIDACPDGTSTVSGVPAPVGQAVSYISNGSGFVRQNLGFQFSGRLKLADVNADGLRDVLVCQDLGFSGSGTHSIKAVLLNNGAGGFVDIATVFGRPSGAALPAPTSGPTVGEGNCKDLRVLDVDGDGREELVNFFASLSQPLGGVPSYRIKVLDVSTMTWRDYGENLWGDPNRGPTLLDANGDGLVDAFFGSQMLAINTGSEFVTTILDGTNVMTSPDAATGVRTAAAFDFDGDGRDDLVGLDGYRRFISSGQFLSQVISTGPSAAMLLKLPALDVDGDGAKDLVSEDGSITLNQSSLRAGLLKSVTDGLGKITSIGYQSSTDGAPTYSVGACQSENTTSNGRFLRNTCLRKVSPLVSAVDEGQMRFGALNPGSQRHYRYFGARAGLDGRGWLGFSSRTIDLGESGVPQPPLWEDSLVYNNEDFLLAGTLASSTRTYLAATAVTPVSRPSFRVEMTLKNWQIAQGDHTHFPFVASEQGLTFEADHLPSVNEVPLTEVDTFRSVDTFGTVIEDDQFVYLKPQTFSGSTLKSGFISETRVDRTNILNDTSSWLLGVVHDTTTTGRRQASVTVTIPRHEHFEYVPSTKLLLSEEREPGVPLLHRKTTYDRLSNGNPQSVCVSDDTDPERCSSFTYDVDQVLAISVTDPDGLTQVQHSPRDGQILWTIDPNGLVSETVRDAFGRPQQIETPTSSGIIHYSTTINTDGPIIFDPQPFPLWPAFAVTSTFAGEGTSQTLYDAFGRVVQESQPGFSGTSSGDIFTQRFYDPLGRLNVSALPHRQSDASQGLVHYLHDARGRTTEVDTPDNLTTSYFYPTTDTILPAFASWFGPTKDGAQAATAVIVQKPRGNLEGRVLDPKGLPVRSFQAPGTAQGGALSAAGSATVDYLYTGFDFVHEMDAAHETGTIANAMDVDAYGRTLELDDPSVGVQKSTYNGFDEVTSATDAQSLTTHFSYDLKGRPTDITLDSGEVLSHFEYSGAGPGEKGRLVSAYRETKPGSGVVTSMRYHYQPGPTGSSDPLINSHRGLVSGIDYRLAATPSVADSGQLYQVGYHYDPASVAPWRVHSVDYPDAGGGPFAVQYDYDATSGALSAVRGTAAEASATYWQLLDTDQGFRPRQEAFGDGFTTVRDYYALGHGTSDCQFTGSCAPGLLRSIVTKTAAQSVGQAPQNIRYTYDENRNISQALPLSSDARGYQYDGFDRLTFENFALDGDVRGYQYDLTGNITQLTTLASGTTVYTYGDPTKPYQVTATADTSYEYDANGRQSRRTGAIPGGQQLLDYDPFGMTEQVRTGTGTGAIDTQFAYDPTGTRVLKRKLRGTTANGADCTANPLACTADLTIDIGEVYEEVKAFSNGCGVDPLPRTG